MTTTEKFQARIEKIQELIASLTDDVMQLDTIEGHNTRKALRAANENLNDAWAELEETE